MCEAQLDGKVFIGTTINRTKNMTITAANVPRSNLSQICVVTSTHAHPAQSIQHDEIQYAAGYGDVVRLKPRLGEKTKTSEGQRIHQHPRLSGTQGRDQADTRQRQGRKDKEQPLIDTLHDDFQNIVARHLQADIRHHLFIANVDELVEELVVNRIVRFAK